MKQKFLWCAALSFVLIAGAFFLRIPARGAALEVSAQSAVVITADTGTVLFEKDAHTQRPMASTTKIMTALLALEEAQRLGDPVVEITEEMVAVEGSSMGLLPGDRITLSNLAAGMLLASGNDAANAVALYLKGSLEAFADEMNSRARELGMENTHFVTPSGLDATSADSQKHHSTAYDMALLAKEALQNQQFREICSSTQRKVAFEEPAKQVSFTNHNKLLSLYPDCIGVKTGYTESAGRCLVSAAERDGTLLIAVTLDAPDDWNDHATLLDYGFSQVEPIPLEGEDVKVTLPVVGSQTPWVYARGSNGGNVSLPCGASSQLERHIVKIPLCTDKSGRANWGNSLVLPGCLGGHSPHHRGRNSPCRGKRTQLLGTAFRKGDINKGVRNLPEKSRLQKILAASGVASRRKAEELIAAGRVTVNGRVAHLGDSALPGKDKIALDGQLLGGGEKDLLALHKPRGFVTTLHDERGRKCVAQLVADVGERVYPVGRLDKDSEGLLLLTNDGDFANRVSHPKRHVAKTYRVTVRPSVTEDQLNQISTGIVIEGRRTAPAKVRVLQEEPGRVVLEIVLYEGRNREIRKMCEALGLEVARLKRIAVGPVRLGMLPQGKYRELTKEELRALNAEIKKGEGNDDPSKSDGKSGRRTGTVVRRRR